MTKYLFRALADQLEGDENAHQKYRHMVVEYIQVWMHHSWQDDLKDIN